VWSRRPATIRNRAHLQAHLEAHELQTPLTRNIATFSRILLYAVLALAAIAFVVGVLRGQPVVETFTAAIALAVAMIPEGCPPH